MKYATECPSPLGPLTLVASDEALLELRFEGSGAPTRAVTPLLKQVERELAEYFAGARSRFDVPLALHGTELETRVWTALAEIPFGETWSYAQLARRIGRPSAARAVGGANARNPIAILIPCHRVVGSDGALRGYRWGIQRKAELLARERRSFGRGARGAA